MWPHLTSLAAYIYRVSRDLKSLESMESLGKFCVPGNIRELSGLLSYNFSYRHLQGV